MLHKKVFEELQAVRHSHYQFVRHYMIKTEYATGWHSSQAKDAAACSCKETEATVITTDSFHDGDRCGTKDT